MEFNAGIRRVPGKVIVKPLRRQVLPPAQFPPSLPQHEAGFVIGGTYILGRLLGNGSYGRVYSCKKKSTGEEFAVKCMEKDWDGGVPKFALRELALLQELSRHPNIVSLEKIITTKSTIYAVLEYVQDDMEKLIFEKRVEFSSHTVKSLIYQLLRGILFCHQRGVIHRDIKPGNLLISKSMNLKIADFGISKSFEIPVKPNSLMGGTLYYRAPECLLGLVKYATSADMWSVGCVFAELTQGQALFQGDSEISQLFTIFRVLGTPNESNWRGVSTLPHFKRVFPKWKQNELHICVPGLKADGLSLLNLLFEYNPRKRISAKEAINHSYFNDFDKSSLPSFDENLA